MIEVRKSTNRGHFNFGWLDTYHTFSFGEYHDPNYVQFSNLRVINEDIVQPGQGFGAHSHRNMEIITYIIDGALNHKDSMGNGSTIYPGDVQRMTAGTGVTHSEFNSSQTEAVHLLQIWILPQERNLSPSYQQIFIPEDAKINQVRLIASQEGGSDIIRLHADAKLFASILTTAEPLTFKPHKNRKYWVQLIKGTLNVNDTILEAGDGASIIDEKTLIFKADRSNVEFLLFELP